MTATPDQLGAVLLAAGRSSRLGQPKQLVNIDGEPLVVRQARLLLDLRLACVTIVTGAAGQEVRQAVEQSGLCAQGGQFLEFTDNEAWAQGMGGSIACGVRAMPERVRGVLLVLCDQWRIGRPDMEGLVNRWCEHPQHAVVACWEEGRGPPVIFPRVMFAALARLKGEHGARQVLKKATAKVLDVTMPNAAFDLDVPADLPGA